MSVPMATGIRDRPALVSSLLGAAAGLTVGLALRVLPFARVTFVARWLASRSRRPATNHEVLRVLRAIDSGARFVPIRVACLERSLAAVLVLGLRRRGVTWCQGVRTPPFASHAWLDDQAGDPMGEPTTTATYQRLLVISPVVATKGSST